MSDVNARIAEAVRLLRERRTLDFHALLEAAEQNRMVRVRLAMLLAVADAIVADTKRVEEIKGAAPKTPWYAPLAQLVDATEAQALDDVSLTFLLGEDESTEGTEEE